MIAWPNGIDNAWNIGPCCTNSRDVDDLGFARAMVTEISKTACIDPKRVYSTGFSMGGGMRISSPATPPTSSRRSRRHPSIC